MVVIEKRDGKYYWLSRDNRELRYAVSGAFHLFTEVKGNGYIKVLGMQNAGGFEYMEHMHTGLTGMTYWGSARRFDP